MDNASFNRARFAVLTEQTEKNGIGTLGEKTLHRILKLAIEPDVSCHEVKKSGYVADILNTDGIVEIQTRSFSRLVPKLDVFLTDTPVTVVYPLPHTKYVRWVDPATGEMTSRRKSPKTSTPYDAVAELSRIRKFLAHPSLTVLLVFLDVEEFRLLDGWNKDHKRGSHRMERIPNALVGTTVLHTPAEYRTALLPDGLPTSFTVKDFCRITKQKKRWGYETIRILIAVGVIEKTGERGKEYLYSPKNA